MINNPVVSSTGGINPLFQNFLTHPHLIYVQYMIYCMYTHGKCT